MRRRWTGFLAAAAILMSSCLPALNTQASAGRSEAAGGTEVTGAERAALTEGQQAGGSRAEYTVEYIERDEENERVLARETFRARAGTTVNVEYKQFDGYVKEEGQDLTLFVTADGGAVKKIY